MNSSVVTRTTPLPRKTLGLFLRQRWAIGREISAGFSARRVIPCEPTPTMSSPSSRDPLSSVMADWRVNPRPAGDFRTSVWNRIDGSRRPSNWPGFARAHPAAVSGLLAAALLLGAWSGRSEAREHTNADRAAIAANYVHALDARWMRHP